MQRPAVVIPLITIEPLRRMLSLPPGCSIRVLNLWGPPPLPRLLTQGVEGSEFNHVPSVRDGGVDECLSQRRNSHTCNFFFYVLKTVTPVKNRHKLDRHFIFTTKFIRRIVVLKRRFQHPVNTTLHNITAEMCGKNGNFLFYQIEYNITSKVFYTCTKTDLISVA